MATAIMMTSSPSVTSTAAAAPPSLTSVAVAAATAAAASSLMPSGGSLALTMAAARQIMLDQYTPWVMGTYGDSAKTKTITTRKYARIVALLKAHEKQENGGGGGSGGEPSGSEAAKFRLWVKSKGFHLGPPAGHSMTSTDIDVDDSSPAAAGLRGADGIRDILFLPTGTDKVIDGKQFMLRDTVKAGQVLPAPPRCNMLICIRVINVVKCKADRAITKSVSMGKRLHSKFKIIQLFVIH
jgi:hypothetical protein